jgi:type IV pilus assembly protein PilC
MATASSKKSDVKEVVFEWEGKDRNGKTVRGEQRAASENQVMASLRRQGVTHGKIKKRKRLVHFHAPVGDHDESGRAFAPSL